MMTSGIHMGLRTAAVCSALLLLPTLAAAQDETGEKAIDARQGFMQIVVREAGPLFAMAKGDIAYDADEAAANAENLEALLQYNFGRLFVPGTSKADHPGKTRALAAIWDDMEGFASAFGQLRERVAVVAGEAANGKDALTAAVGEMGKACGNCHDNFRADDF